MSQNNYQFAYHVSQIAKQLSLGQTSKIKEYVASLDAATQEQLSPWLAYVLLNESVGQTCDKNTSLKDYEACTQGWTAYYQHDYLQAHQFFTQAIQQDNWQHYALNSALGLAKVYTRTGHWQAARDWCLYYLSLARQETYHFEVAKGYGALAEIFLRASCANEALACFQTAYHLMPLGQGQQAKQYNFMASALLRNKEALRAEVLLHTSRQISRNQLDLDPNNQDALASLCHSTLRFYYLNISNHEGYEPAEVNADDAQLMTQISDCNRLTSVPLGLLQVAKGIACLAQDLGQAQAHFTQAMHHFGPKLVMEYQWAARLKASCIATATDQGVAEMMALFELQPIQPPVFAVVADATWQKVPLHNHGFLPLTTAQTPEQLAALWMLFFI
ncbi:hypothetical protein CBP31_13065 [Oceanisphaera profunda]|uniref:Tetratricopeptide repeat protein n=1 Tax=Oceanisphaera profunda TaxID=1416627 RepID=A0A1Y0D8C5_9GAMM|nr:hypothetical protein [Oceanisphaera profunda]ART83437.1 hypothetical protein CBP31_13065 [Oceanisphaera profunda]